MAEDAKPKNDPQQPLLTEADIDKEALVEQAIQNLGKQPSTGTLRDQIQSPKFKEAVVMVLGDDWRADRFVRVALTAMMRTPDLADCSQTSLFRALLDLSSFGLEPDGRRAHLIPYRNNKKCMCGHDMDAHRLNECSKCKCRQRRTLMECQLILDYKGLVELVRRSGEISYIHADVVYSNDQWSYAYGSQAHLNHTPNLANRGETRVAFYSYARLKDGSEEFMVLSPAEVESVRKRSKAASSGPWVTDYDEMGKKTAFRRHSKWLPLATDVRRAVEKDDGAIDASGWEELLEPAKEQEIQPATTRPALKDMLMPAAGSPEAAKEV